jgi:hypothetical protein
MGQPLYAARVEHLNPNEPVTVSCNSCSHTALVPVERITKLLPGWVMIKDMHRLFRCQQCDRKGDVIVDAQKSLGNR